MMTTEQKKSDTQKSGSGPDISISMPELIKDLYNRDATKPQLDIGSVKYSNLAYIEASDRDVHIDFLEMPGIKRDGRVYVSGTRVYMSHSAARRLAEVLPDVLKKAQAGGHVKD